VCIVDDRSRIRPAVKVLSIIFVCGAVRCAIRFMASGSESDEFHRVLHSPGRHRIAQHMFYLMQETSTKNRQDAMTDMQFSCRSFLYKFVARLSASLHLPVIADVL